MADKLVVGVDGRSQSGDALALAGHLAEGSGAELAIAAVLEYSPLPIEARSYERALAEHFDEIFDAVLAAGEPSAPYTLHRLSGPSPPRALSELAEELGAPAIVLGSTHRGLLGRVLPGSVGDRLLSAGPCAIAIAPRGYAEADAGPIRRIAVGYDGGRESDAALQKAIELAGELDAALLLVAVIPEPDTVIAEIATPLGYDELVRKQLEDALAAAAEQAAPLEVETELGSGEPAEALCESSAGADLLIVGSRGYGPLRRSLLGGVSSKVIRGARTPVLVVPRGADGS